MAAPLERSVIARVSNFVPLYGGGLYLAGATTGEIYYSLTGAASDWRPAVISPSNTAQIWDFAYRSRFTGLEYDGPERPESIFVLDIERDFFLQCSVRTFVALGVLLALLDCAPRRDCRILDPSCNPLSILLYERIAYPRFSYSGESWR